MFTWFKRRKVTSDASNGRYQNGNKYLIELQQVVKTYEGVAGTFVALNNVDLQVNQAVLSGRAWETLCPADFRRRLLLCPRRMMRDCKSLAS